MLNCNGLNDNFEQVASLMEVESLLKAGLNLIMHLKDGRNH